MALGSRIQSEPLRRVILAAIMVVVLIGSTAVAMRLTRVRTHHNYPALRTEDLGVVRIDRPVLWDSAPLPERGNAPLEPLGCWEENGRDHRRLAVYQYHTPRPTTPEAILAACSKWLGREDALIQTSAAVRSPTMTGRMLEGLEYFSDSPEEKIFLADLTTDGRFHLVIYLEGEGAVTNHDYHFMKALTESASDQRYQMLEDVFDLRGVQLDLPRGAVALKNTADKQSESVIIIPGGLSDFYLLELSAERLSSLNLLLPAGGVEGPQPPAALKALVSKSRDGTADDRLVALLAVKYWKVMGKMPPTGAFRRFRASTGLDVPLTSPTSVSYRAIWAVRLDDEQAAVMEILASPTGAPTAYLAGQLVLRGMGVMADAPEAPVPQIPASPGKSPAPSTDKKAP